MAIQLEHHQIEIRARVDEVLHYVWDPIDVAGVPEARDEYDSYITPILNLLHEGKNENEVTTVLLDISTSQMGFAKSRHLKKRAQQASEALIRWAKIIQDQDDYHTKWKLYPVAPINSFRAPRFTRDSASRYKMNDTQKASLIGKYNCEPTDFPMMDYNLLTKLENYITSDTKIEHSLSSKPVFEIHLKEKAFRSVVRSILDEYQDSYQAAFIHNPIPSGISNHDLKEPLKEHLMQVIELIKIKNEMLYVFSVLVVSDEEFGLTIYWNTEEAHRKNIKRYQDEYGAEYQNSEKIYGIKHNQGDFSYADHDMNRDQLDAFFDDYNRSFEDENPDWEAPSYEKAREQSYKLLIESTVEVLKGIMSQFQKMNTTPDFQHYVDAYDLDSAPRKEIAKKTIVNANEAYLNFIAN